MKTLFYFASCKKDIYSFNTSPEVEKEKKKGMMDINLRYVAAVIALGGDLYHLLNIHTIALYMCKNGWALHYVVKKKRWGAVLRYWQHGRYRPNNRLYANSNGYAIHNNKGNQVSCFYCSNLGHLSSHDRGPTRKKC